MSDIDQQEDGRGTPLGTPRRMEMTTRIAFYISLVIMLMVFFLYVRSMGTENETWSLLIFLVLMGTTAVLGSIWRRNYWKMRRAALEDGFD